MQVIEDLNLEVDKRINDLILGNLSYFLEGYETYVTGWSRHTLCCAYAGIIELYTRHKRIFKKSLNPEYPKIHGQDYNFIRYSNYIKYEKLKEEYRVILTENNINYKEVQKNLSRYLWPQSLI